MVGMKRVLMISSFLAGSNVGGSVAMKALSRLDVDVCLVPTTLLGRHPGWGPPGGGAVPDELFKGMLDGLIANDIPEQVDAIVTGYFASAEQVDLVAELIFECAASGVPIIVDAIMGDLGKGLYVKEKVADAIVKSLVPQASLVKCNAWEFWEILRRQGVPTEWPNSPERAGEFDILERYLKTWAVLQPHFITSIRKSEAIGAICVDYTGAYWSGHEYSDAGYVPNGLGDYLSCLIARDVMQGKMKPDSLLSSVMGDFIPVFEGQSTSEPGELRLPRLNMGSDKKRLAPVEKI